MVGRLSGFKTSELPWSLGAAVAVSLQQAASPEDVRAIFHAARNLPSYGLHYDSRSVKLLVTDRVDIDGQLDPLGTLKDDIEHRVATILLRFWATAHQAIVEELITALPPDRRGPARTGPGQKYAWGAPMPAPALKDGGGVIPGLIERLSSENWWDEQWRAHAADDLAETAREAWRRTSDYWADNLPNVRTGTFDPNVRNTAAMRYSNTWTDSVVQGFGTTTRNGVGAILSLWYGSPGATLGDLSAALRDYLDVNSYRARLIAQTETTRAANAATAEAAERYNVMAAGTTRAVLVWQTMNDRSVAGSGAQTRGVCDICWPRHLQAQAPETWIDPPPAHPGCRCFTTIRVMVVDAAGAEAAAGPTPNVQPPAGPRPTREEIRQMPLQEALVATRAEVADIFDAVEQAHVRHRELDDLTTRLFYERQALEGKMDEVAKRYEQELSVWGHRMDPEANLAIDEIQRRWAAELDPLAQRQTALREEYTARYNEMSTVLRDAVSRVLPLQGEPGIALRDPLYPYGDRQFTRRVRARVQEGFDYVRSVVSDRLIPRRRASGDFGGGFQVQIDRLRRGMGGHGRAHQSDNNIIINPRYDGAATIVHELGHVIEQYDPHVHERAVDFLLQRTSGQNPQWLGGNYARDEVAVADGFEDAYMGKYYISRGVPESEVYRRFYATEIISMGLQRMYENPRRFMRQDEEYFTFIVGVIRGIL